MLALIIVFVALGLGSTACSKPETSDIASDAPRTSKTQVVTTDQGTFRVELETVPNPAPLNEHFRLRLRVYRGDQPATDVAVIADADMPAHKHGMNTKPVTHDRGDGVFETEGMLFHMSGAWELYVNVVDEANNGRTERARFSFDVEP